MFVVYKSGKVFLETNSYQQACREARMDAYRHRLSTYTIYDKGKATPGKPEKHIYRITGGMAYEIPNPPRKQAA